MADLESGGVKGGGEDGGKGALDPFGRGGVCRRCFFVAPAVKTSSSEGVSGRDRFVSLLVPFTRALALGDTAGRLDDKTRGWGDFLAGRAGSKGDELPSKIEGGEEDRNGRG